MAEEKKVKKIVVSSEYELTDLVNEIIQAKEDRLILTFAEESSLLISPINLKVILETADEKEKSVMLQIIQNPSGVRNAKMAGLYVINTATAPEESVWEEVNQEKETRLNPPKKEASEKVETEEVNNEEDMHKPSDFEKKINQAIQKSKDQQPIPKEKEKEDEDAFISFGKDIPSGEEPKIEDNSQPKIEDVKQPDLSKVDFKNAPTPQQAQTDQPKKESKPLIDFKKIFSKKEKPAKTTGANSTNITPYPPSKWGKVKKYLPYIAVSVLVVALLSLFAYYKIASFVKIKVYVETKEVSVEETFTGDENIKEVDFEDKKIPIKIETVEKSRSTTTTATGTAYRGNKATGTVTITYTKGGDCTDGETITLPTGQVIESNSGYSYTLDSETTITCNGMSETSVTAIEVGEEYNISSGSFFTVQNYTSSQVYGLNSSGAFTGGSKEEYTVLSQADVDSAVDELKENAIEEGEQELKDKSSTWTIIESSIESDIVEDSVTSDVGVGAEASNVNISLKTESSATYYLSDGFDDGIADLLTQKAEQENLFDSSDGLSLTLGDNITKDVSVVSSKDDIIKIKLVASGRVKPDVDKETIVSNLKGKSWDEGISYLDTLNYSTQQIEVTFNPDTIPDRFWYFPNKQGGVLVSIEEVTVD